MKIIEFSIPRTPPSLNVMLRQNWNDRGQDQKNWDEQVFVQWLMCGKLMFLNPVKISYVLYFPNEIRRDLDNYLGGTKYITDALKRTFFTRDDYKWLQDINISFRYGKEKTVVCIEEVA
jgi:Holliday junction resolvase RusA-like endonuclease